MAEKKTPVKKPAAAKKPAAPKKAAAVKAAAKVETPVLEVAVSIKTEGRDFLKALGRRKEASAQVRLYPAGKGTISVNDKDFKVYFPVFDLQELILGPLRAVGREGKVDVTAKTRGGGIRGQATAVQLGIARALVILDPGLRTTLKKIGFLSRDPRVKERKKYGLKKARRAPQWAKR